MYLKLLMYYTDNNDLFLYDKGNKDWIKQGNYPVKKIEILNNNITFMLTNDGRLYYKGSKRANIVDAHTEFTQIFPDCYFYDFTFSNDNLTVLKD